MINRYKNNNSRNIFAFLLALVCFMTNISQLPQLVGRSSSKLVSYSVWIIMGFYLVAYKKIKFDTEVIKLLVLVGIFLCMILLGELIYPNKYLKSDYIQPFCLSIFLIIIGYNLSYLISRENFRVVLKAFVLSICIVAMSIYLKFFTTGFAWSDRSYAYGSKNSVSQLILTTIIIVYLIFDDRSKVLTFVKSLTLIFLTIILMMLKSRASILGFFIFIFIILVKNKNKKNKIIIFTFVSIFVLFLFINKDFYDLVINQILLGARDKSNFNDITSGRFDMFINFPKVFSKNIFIGRGTYFIESFPLCVLVQYGIIGSIPLIIMSLKPLIFSIKNNKKIYSLENFILLILSICYLFNGIFEQLAPFGPGVKNYLLWLMYGLCIGWKKKEVKRGKNG